MRTGQVPEVTIRSVALLTCTYNRAGDLRDFLESAVCQELPPNTRAEIVVVNNGSTDTTAAVVQEFKQRSPLPIRYLVEERPGKSYALNTGLAALDSDVYVIADDDFILPVDWIQKIVNAFDAVPNAAFVGGRVLPRWEVSPPDWLSDKHWAPLALADYGARSFIASGENPICLLACAFRSSAVREAGAYDVDLGVNRSRIGGTEDLALLEQLWERDFIGVYSPDLWFFHKVPKGRMTRRYHRRWHFGHGRSRALMDAKRGGVGGRRILNIPGYVIREGTERLGATIREFLRGRLVAAFEQEVHVWFAAGFAYQILRGSSERKI